MFWEKLYVLIFLTALFHILKEFQHFATSRVQLNGAFSYEKKSESVKWIWTTNLRRTVNPFPNKPRVLCVCSLSLLKTLGKKMLLIRSNFFFSNSISVGIWVNFLPFSSNLKLSSANSFSMGLSKICRLGKSQKKGALHSSFTRYGISDNCHVICDFKQL